MQFELKEIGRLSWAEKIYLFRLLAIVNLHSLQLLHYYYNGLIMLSACIEQIETIMTTSLW